LSSVSLPPRLPLSFQLPTTAFERIRTLKTLRFYRVAAWGANRKPGQSRFGDGRKLGTVPVSGA
jgi:hypothetical protein